MTIDSLMKDRAALTAEIDAIPTDLASEPAFKRAFDRKWKVERSILAQKPTTLDELKYQLRILADRYRDLGDPQPELERLAGE